MNEYSNNTKKEAIMNFWDSTGKTQYREKYLRFLNKAGLSRSTFYTYIRYGLTTAKPILVEGLYNLQLQFISQYGYPPVPHTRLSGGKSSSAKVLR